jgi:hypothetical protein
MTYFTITPSIKSGFTDQLLQLTVLMTIGKSLDFSYYHTILNSIRSSGIENDRSDDIYDFLGINDYLRSLSSPPCKHPIIVQDIELSDEVVLSNQIHSLNQLLQYISFIVESQTPVNEGDLMVNFFVTGKRTFFKYIVQDDRFHQYSLNLREIYDQTRIHWPHPSLFTSGTLKKILIHVRQGDISVIKTPWETYIPVDKRIEGWLDEFQELANIKSLRDVNQLLFPVDFSRFLSVFNDCFASENSEMLIFSDGYDRAFQMIFDNINHFGFSDQQKQDLRISSENYNEIAFRDFDAFQNYRMFIGESVPQLFDLVDSVINADIVIVGVQQRMIVKLVAQFCPDSGPVVVVLFRSEMPDFSNIHPRDKERFIYVDINHYDVGDICNRIEHDAIKFNRKMETL